MARRLLRFLLALAALSIAVTILPRVAVVADAMPLMFSVESVETRPVALVFGAGLTRNGTASPELSERVAKAAQLFFAGKVEKLLMSGDNRFIYYNEPAAMAKAAISLGVPSDAIVLDYAGRRTYDSCYRARDIFEIRHVILVTQEYHLPRALFTCRELGIDALGVPANAGQIPHLYGNLREIPATLAALWDVYLGHPMPVLGKPEPIFSAGSLRGQWAP
jgi:SanA protein